jgi:hypothetical protein
MTWVRSISDRDTVAIRRNARAAGLGTTRASCVSAPDEFSR